MGELKAVGSQVQIALDEGRKFGYRSERYLYLRVMFSVVNNGSC